MSRPTPAASIEADHPLLARDPTGNLLPFPDGTAAWRIARETGGRLFEIRGADKAWVRIPIDAAPEHVAEQWGPGVYRVYALDAVGGSLHKEHVARWDLRNAGNASYMSPSDLRPTLLTAPSAPTGPTDLRFALEAMTHMLRTNSDALRMVAESHVDLAKSIAAAKGLPRNANLTALRALPAPEPEDGDDEDDTEAEPDVPAWVNQVLVPLAPVIKLGSDFLSSKLMPRTPEPQSASPSASANGNASQPLPSEEIDMDLVNAPGFEARDVVDLNYAYRKNKAKRAHKAATESSSTASVSLAARVMQDPELAERVMAVRSQMPADDAALLMKGLQSLTEEQLNELVAGLKSRSVSDAVSIALRMVADLRQSIDEASATPAGER